MHAVTRAARMHWGGELRDVVPGHSTVLLVWETARPDVRAVTSFLGQFAEQGNWLGNGASASAEAAAEPVIIPVRYDGPDLPNVAARLGISEGEVVRLHSTARYTVAFSGFAPGFAYLVGGDPRLNLPRLAVPRTDVPAGSVAVAAGYSGIYPRRSPGGWNLLGRTEVVLFDPEREPPALLTPGMHVQFEPRPLARS